MKLIFAVLILGLCVQARAINFRGFDNITFRAASGFCDVHLEIISIDEKAKTAVYSSSDVISHEKNTQIQGSCEGYQACNGSSDIVVCENSGMCFFPRDEMKVYPSVTLMPDGNILAEYSQGLIKLTRSPYQKWWRCGQ